MRGYRKSWRYRFYRRVWVYAGKVARYAGKRMVTIACQLEAVKNG